jgi:hypothetical protein
MLSLCALTSSMILTPLLETTANTLSAALALLGFDQAVQEDVYQSIQNVLGDREPVRPIVETNTLTPLTHGPRLSKTMIN